LAKGTEILAHKNTLLAAEVRTLRKANEALSKRRRAKKNRIRKGGALTVEEAHDILAQEEVEEQIRRDKRSSGVVKTRGNRARGAVEIADRLVIIRGLVKRI
jgi:uncharacterized protein YaiL (DUF2058 family)